MPTTPVLAARWLCLPLALASSALLAQEVTLKVSHFLPPNSNYQKGVLESEESAQRTFKLFEGTAQAMSRSAERMQVTAEHTGKEIQATFTQLAGKVQTLYTPLA